MKRASSAFKALKELSTGISGVAARLDRSLYEDGGVLTAPERLNKQVCNAYREELDEVKNEIKRLQASLTKLLEGKKTNTITLLTLSLLLTLTLNLTLL